jgi:ribose 5-phosphate isomerase B
MRIAIGADHVGFPLKQSVVAHLEALGHEVVDYGVRDFAEVDYPDVAVAVARDVAAGQFDRAILVCGTGIGMAMVANKVPGVRAASVSDPYSAERARKSNNAQVLCLGSRIVGAPVADLLVDHWLASEFAGGASERKVAKVDALDARLARAPGLAGALRPEPREAPDVAAIGVRDAEVGNLSPGQVHVGTTRSG